MFIVAGASLSAIISRRLRGRWLRTPLAPILLYAGIERLFGDLIEVY
jgi:uncharacterized membrane protein YfcA